MSEGAEACLINMETKGTLKVIPEGYRKIG